MTSKQLRALLTRKNIKTKDIAALAGYTQEYTCRQVRYYDVLKPDPKERFNRALFALLGGKPNPIDIIADNGEVYWRFAERDANAELRRGYGGGLIRPRWVPTTLYPILQFGGESMLPKPPPDMRWALRDVLDNEETAVQAFDRLIDTSTGKAIWREAEPVGAVV